MEVFPEVVSAAPTSLAHRGSSLAPAPCLRRSLSLVTLAWMFGAIWFNTTAGEPLTLFAQKLGATNFEFGVLTALPFLASLMGLPGSLLIEWTGKRKQVFLGALYLQRAMWFVIAIVPLWILNRSGGSSSHALLVFLVLMLLMYAIGSTGGPAWLSWMSDLVPSRINGKYFSRRRQWGIVTAIPAAVFVGWFLDRRVAADSSAVLHWCAIFFICSAVCGLAHIDFFRHVPAIARPPKKPGQLLKALSEPLHDGLFMRCSIFVGLLTFALNFLGQFATLYLLEQVGIDNLGVQMVLVVTPMVAQLLVLGVWGRAADRIGQRPLLKLASIGLVPVGLGWCLVTPQTAWLGYVLSGLGAGLWAGVEVANLNLVLETSSKARHGASGYAAINGVIINIAGCLGGLAAGIIAQECAHWHWQPVAHYKTLSFYDILFIAGGMMRLVCLGLFHFAVPKPAKPVAAPPRDRRIIASAPLPSSLAA